MSTPSDKVAKDKVVSIDYTLTNQAGQVIDSSQGREPLTYLHGHGGLIPGMEKGLEGKSAGETFTLTLAPEEGYGHKDPDMVQPVPRSNFAGVPNIEKGMQFQARSPDGRGARVVDCFYNMTLEGGETDFSSVAQAPRALVEQVVEVDAAFVERYLNDGDVDPQELHAPLRQALREGHLIPICVVSARTTSAGEPSPKSMVTGPAGLMRRFQKWRAVPGRMARAGVSWAQP